MSIFISPQDYLMSPNDCEQISCSICGYNYKMWCKKEKVEQAKNIIEKILPIIEKTAKNYSSLSFDKILFISMIEILSKEKEFKINTNEQEENNKITNQNEFEKERENLINDFIEILTIIKQELENDVKEEQKEDNIDDINNNEGL